MSPYNTSDQHIRMCSRDPAYKRLEQTDGKVACISLIVGYSGTISFKVDTY